MVGREISTEALAELAGLDATPDQPMNPQFGGVNFFMIRPYDFTNTKNGSDSRSGKDWQKLSETRISTRTEPLEILERVLYIAGASHEEVRPYVASRYLLYGEMADQGKHSLIQRTTEATNPGSILNLHFTALQEHMYDQVGNGAFEHQIGKAQHIGSFVVHHAKEETEVKKAARKRELALLETAS